MRLATYNVEWFNSLFDNANRPLIDDHWSARRDVTRAQRWQAVGDVFAALNADAVMIIEAPDTNSKRDTVQALEVFAQAFDLRARRAVVGFQNDTQQEIALLYDPDIMKVFHDPQGAVHGEISALSPRFDGDFHIDLDVDATEDKVRFSKPPLELCIETVSGVVMRIIGAHLKSKAPYGATSPEEEMRIAIANRRKQLAQAIWLRRRVDEVLASGKPAIVMGDLNDGPGLDEYEQLFGRSSVEIVMGGGADGLWDPHARQVLQRRFGAVPTTSRFFIPDQGRYLQALLDYIFVSPDLRERSPVWRIWHPFDDPACWGDAALREALIAASDHYPVTIDIDL